ncbi:MAG: tetratricopeptide repeat protein [Gemmatimonadota bacterium]|nr:tetratricopeptide repeat protein [Gemmatimonadota bacterium]
MKNLIHEIHRRSLWQVLGIYLAGSWVALQVVEQLAEAAALPDWVRPFSLALLVLGFPIVMATAFVQEGLSTKAQEAPKQSLADVGEVPPPPAPDPVGHQRLLTWRNAMMGGVLAFAVLGLGTFAFMAMRTAGIGPAGTLVAKGVLDARAGVIVADFESTADDPGLAQAATLALRTDLSQSQVITVLEPSEIAGVLQRMQRSPDEPLTPELARDAATREGVPAVVEGEITAAGGAYVVAARLIGTETGDVLVSERARASDEAELLDAIDELSGALRSRIGESYSVLRAEPPLETVTTTSLPALRKYTEAIRAIEAEGQPERGVALLEEAIALDPEFAMAWRKLGVELGNRRENAARRVQAMTRAFELRDRLTPIERYMTMASYYTGVTNEADRAITAYENLLDLDPTNSAALNNLGQAYYALRDFERAEENYLLGAAVDSSNSIPFTNAVNVQLDLGKLSEADTMQSRTERLFPGDPWVTEMRAGLQAGRGDDAAAVETTEALRDELIGNLFWRSRTSRSLAALRAMRGKLAAAEEELRQAINTDRQRGLPGEVLEEVLTTAQFDIWVRRDPARGLARLESALIETPLETIDPLDRPYPFLINVFAVAGRPDRASDLLAELESTLPDEAKRGMEWDVLRARGMIALAEDRYDEALDLLRRSDRGGCPQCAAALIGPILDEAGRTEEAIAAYTTYNEMPASLKYHFDAVFAGHTLERLGELYDETGDFGNAARYYAAFVELWSDADAELQPRVRAAQTRLDAIMAEIG